VAEMEGVNPYQSDYDEAVLYLVDNDYLEPCPGSSYWFYRMANKGREEVLNGRVRSRAC
jgi:hypothetical protein